MKELKMFPNYFITEDGKLYSNRSGELKQMKTTIATNGYEMVTISIKGIRHKCLIHRLVATTYLDNPNNYTDVDHIDCTRNNNNINNLRWVTRSYNIQRAVDSGRKTYETCTKQINVYCNRKLIHTGTGLVKICKEIAKQYDVSETVLIKNRKHKNISIEIIQ